MPRALDAGDAPRGIPARAQREHPDPYTAVGAHAPHHPRRVPLRRDIADPRRARFAGDRPLEPFGHVAIGSGRKAVLARGGLTWHRYWLAQKKAFVRLAHGSPEFYSSQVTTGTRKRARFTTGSSTSDQRSSRGAAARQTLSTPSPSRKKTASRSPCAVADTTSPVARSARAA